MARLRKTVERAISDIDTAVRLSRARTKRVQQTAELSIEKQEERRRWLGRTRAALQKKGLLPK